MLIKKILRIAAIGIFLFSTGYVSAISKEQKTVKKPATVKNTIRKKLGDMFVKMGFTEEYYQDFVLRQMAKGEEVIVPDENIKIFKDFMIIKAKSKFLKPPQMTETELDIEIKTACKQLSDSDAQTMAENYFKNASYAKKKEFLKTENKFYLNSPSYSVKLKVKKKDDAKKCKEACDTVCTFAPKKTCDWVCKETGWPKKKICKKYCRTIVEQKCKDVCRWICD